tara:strand:- start:151 stop:1128 length:978 start_codon:yes stop_codon:yes gene_type:complete
VLKGEKTLQITFLGTSSGVPTLARNVSAMVLRLPQRSELWLFDCGEATQHQFIRSDLRLSQLRRIFITHMHGDHLFGLPGLLASIGLSGNSSGIDIYGPAALENYLYGIIESTRSRIGYPINIHPVEESANKGKVLIEDKNFVVSCCPLIHRIPSYAYRVDEKPKPGRFNLELAKELKIKPGPIYAALQNGEKVQLKDGRILNGEDFCGPKRIGRSMVYCTDTVFAETAVHLSKKADLLIHEATYAHQDSDLALKRQHSTSTMAAQTAAEAKVGQLILTHLSPRYAPGNKITAKELLHEAKAIFPNTLLAKDFLRLEVKHRCNSS